MWLYRSRCRNPHQRWTPRPCRITKAVYKNLSLLTKRTLFAWIESVGGRAGNSPGGTGEVTNAVLYGPQVTDENLKKLARLPFLFSLDLVNCPVTDAGLKDLASLGQLTVLTLNKTKVTGSGLKYLPNLKLVYLLSSPVSDVGLRDIASLKQISTLYVQGKEITDKSMEEVGKLKDLQILHLTDVQVTDEGVKALTKLPLPRFQKLVLKRSRVTDTAIELLIGARLRLIGLDLSDLRVSDAGVKRLGVFNEMEHLACKRNGHHRCLHEGDWQSQEPALA